VKDGGADFEQTIETLAPELRPKVTRLFRWAKHLETDGLATLWGSHGPQYTTLLPYPKGHDAGLVTVVSDDAVWLWRSVFEKRAPNSIPLVEAALGGPLKQGGIVLDPSDQLLAAVANAYAEARDRFAVPGQSLQGRLDQGDQGGRQSHDDPIRGANLPGCAGPRYSIPLTAHVRRRRPGRLQRGP
jgi:hypothetical protein